MGAGVGAWTTRRVYSYGDSLTDGSTISGILYGYVFNLRDYYKLNLTNRAVGGTRIADAGQMGRILSDPLTVYDSVIFLTGYNDMRFSGTDSSAQNTYKANLITCLQHWSDLGCKVVLGNCLKMPTAGYSMYSPYNNGSDTAVSQFNTKISEAIVGFGNVTLVDVSGYNPNTAGNTQGDLVHPTAQGFAAIATIFESAVGANWVS